MTLDYTKKGCRIILKYTDDPYTKLKSGDKGTIQCVNFSETPDMESQIYVNWDNGSNLSLLIGRDTFSIMEEKEEVTHKLEDIL